MKLKLVLAPLLILFVGWSVGRVADNESDLSKTPLPAGGG
jgi:hypothetical protein